jgi:hypothetical protein
MSRVAADIHDDDSYGPLMSRGGLVLLERRHTTAIGTTIRSMSERCYDWCVFNPVTGDRTFLSCRSFWFHTYVLLTAADGIGCPFMLLAANLNDCHISGEFTITVQATEAGGTAWGPVTLDAHSIHPFSALQDQREPIVLHGGIIHWLLSGGDQALTYDVRTQKLGTAKLPPTSYRGRQRILGTSPDGRLRMLGAKGFVLSMWVRRSDGWAKEAVIDVEHKVMSLYPGISIGRRPIEFKRWGHRSDAVLLQAYCSYRDELLVLDLETKEMHMHMQKLSFFLEVDLSMQLQATKIY